MEVEAIVGYIHPICNFTQLGIHQNSFVERQMKLFKKASLDDIFDNWRLLIGDQSIFFNAKCEQISTIVRYLESNFVSESEKATIQNFLESEALLPASEIDQFFVLEKLCTNSKAPVLDQHIYHLNPSLTVNEAVKGFLKLLGIPDVFPPAKYVQAVESLTNLNSELEVKQVRDILEFLQTESVNNCSKLPDEDRIMQNAKSLCLNDFQLTETLNELKPNHCHKDIPHDLARYFGVKTKRSMLEELSTDPSFEVFSQREDLCNRLKRITMGYSNKMDVFKELIQNADDAKASEIHFILDQRNLAKSRVVNENWEKLLDPALLVFNDAFFTSQDIAGIKDLGKGSKGSSDDKIGQFGVGFNCVYTLTDFPCFLTQVDGEGMGNLCLFDPSRQITPWCGKKINLNEDNLKNFPDTFGCFLTEKPEFDATMGKTMFRLPLRNQISKLAENLVSLFQLKSIMDQLTERIPSYLLFLRNINKISVSLIGQMGEMQTLKSVSKQTELLSDNSINRVKIFNNDVNANVISEWIVSEQIGSTQTLPEIVAKNSFSYKFIQRASVAYPLMSNQSFGGDHQSVPGVWCFLPLEEISEQFRRGSYERQMGKGSFLPVAVNSHFQLDESRRMISLTKNEVKGSWNSFILEHVVGAAYASLVKFFVRSTEDDSDKKLEMFLAKLPQLSGHSTSVVPELPLLICKGLIRALAQHPWIPRVGLDCHIETFETPETIRNLVIRSQADRVVYKICSKLDMPLSQIEPKFTSLWNQCGLALNLLNANDALENLARHSHPQNLTNIKHSVFESRDNLVVFLSWSAKAISMNQNPNSLPIFLSADGMLQQNTWNKLYSSHMNIAEIFPSLRSRILDPKVEQVLTSLKITCDLTMQDFFHLMKCDFGHLLQREELKLENCRDISANWVKLVWDFLACKREATLSQYKDELLSFSILMCRNTGSGTTLVPVGLGEIIVFENLETITMGSVSVNLNKFSCFYELDATLKNASGSKRAAFVSELIVPKTLTVENHIKILELINAENNLIVFPRRQRQQLYTYFRDSFINDSSQFSSDSLEKLAALPIFTFASGEVKTLVQDEAIVVIPSCIPRDGIDFFAYPNYAFQEESRGLDFQERLGFVVKTNVEFYSRTVIPEIFPVMLQNQLKAHLSYIGQELTETDDDDKDVVADALKLCMFVVDNKGKRNLPSEVYQEELKVVIGYVQPTANFTAIGVEEDSILDEIVGFYKTVSEADAMTNWVALVEDDSKSFDKKCLEIGEIIMYVHGLQLDTVSSFTELLENEQLLPADDSEVFCKSSLICTNNSMPIYSGYFHHLHRALVKNDAVKNFVKRCDVVEFFAVVDYVDLINNVTEVPTEIQIVQLLHILQFLEKNKSEVDQLPDTDMIMRPIDDLCLNDFELSSSFLESSLIFPHDKLPHKLCKSFGVKTKRKKLQEMNSDSGFEPFFQREDISRRLARIAESYSNPMDIFKELIQNADDAEASEIHFIFDERQHLKRNVIDDGWEHLLEPALLVFNNNYFKTSDLDGLQDLGHGSKFDHVDKIGQFGVGFNCVYSLTDYPSILTQVDGKGAGDLLLLDPLATLCEKGGTRLRLSQRYLDVFPDSFNCYMREKAQLDATKGGTMFRFPLRSRRSKLGNAAPPRYALIENLKELADNIPRYLLFLNNIRTIRVSMMSEFGSFKTISAHSKQLSASDNERLQILKGLSKQNANSVNGGSQRLQVLYDVEIVDILNFAPKTLSVWSVCQQSGCDEPIPAIIGSRKSTIIKVKQTAAIAFRSHMSAARISEIDRVPGIWCFLPLEEISNQLRGGNKTKWTANYEEKPTLPVAVNSHFLLDESRRMLSLAIKEPRGAWNTHALEHLAGPAYASLIMQKVGQWDQSKANFKLPDFEKLFPSSSNVIKNGPDTSTVLYWLTKGLLNGLQDQRWIPVITFDSKLKMFSPVTEVKNFLFEHGSDKKNRAIFEISQNLGLNMTHISSKIRNVLVGNGLKLKNLEPVDLIEKLYQQSFSVVSIEESVFKSVSNLIAFLDWSTGAITGFHSPKQLPIYLSADNYIQKADGDLFYSSELKLEVIFPQLCRLIFHPEFEWLFENKVRDLTQAMPLNEFLSFLQTHFPQMCQGETLPQTSSETKNITSWIELVWNFLNQHSKIIPQYDSELDSLSILLCKDRNGQCFLKPVSSGMDEIFQYFPHLKIGSVDIDIRRYDGFFELHSCLHRQFLSLSRSSIDTSLASTFVLSKNLTVDQEINVIHKIRKQINLDNYRKLQLYEHFKNSFCNNQKSISGMSFSMLSEIPIFQIIPNSFEDLHGVMAVYSIPSKMPKAGLSLTKTLADKYVLEENRKEGREFQRLLGIVSKTVDQVYVETVVPLLFHKFEWNDLATHLKFLSDNLDQMSGKKPILLCLQDCAFIAENDDEDDSEKRIASYFYDPNCDLFRTFKHENLLPNRYKRFVSLLTQFGLNSKVSEDDFWNFITLYGTNVVKMSGTIFGHFLEAFGKLSLDCGKFVKIGSLPIFETLKHGHRTLKGVFLNEHRELVEFVQPVLTTEFSQMLTRPRNGSKRSFWQIWLHNNPQNSQEKPTSEIVLENLQQILNEDGDHLHDLKIRKCLKYIVQEANKSSIFINSYILQKLSKVPCIRTEQGNYVPPRQICKSFECPISLHNSSDPQLRQFCELKAYIDEPDSDFLQIWPELEVLQATKSISLQQTVFAINQFCRETSAEIRSANPNMNQKFDNIAEHFFWMARKNEKAIRVLSDDCSLYLKTKDGDLHCTSECIIIDNNDLYNLLNDKAQNNGSEIKTIFSASQVLDIPYSMREKLKLLPTGLRPKFLQEICKFDTDERTFQDCNSTSSQFNVDRVVSKLADDDFLQAIAHLIDNKASLFEWMTSFITKQPQQSFDVKKLHPLRSFKLFPVKTVYMRYSIQFNGAQINDVIENDFEFIDNSEPCFVFSYAENFDLNRKKNLFRRLAQEMLHMIDCNEDTQVVKAIAQLMFVDHDAHAVQKTFSEWRIPPLICKPDSSRDHIIGKTVPWASVALIDYNPRREFRDGEIVVVKTTGEGNDAVFMYGLFESVKSEGNLSGDPCQFPIYLIKTGNFEPSELSGEVVFGLKEKVDSDPDERSGKTPEEQDEEFQQDIEELKQLVWVAVDSQEHGQKLEDNMNNLQRRTIEHIIRKYPDSEKQQRVVRAVTEAIKTQMEAKKNQVNSTCDHDSDDTDGQREREEIVTNFIWTHYERMNSEIQQHRNLRSQIESSSRRSTQSSPYYSNSSARSTGTNQSGNFNLWSYYALDWHREILQRPQPHPPLARLWLKQSQEHVTMLDNWPAISDIPCSCRNWALDISMKVYIFVKIFLIFVVLHDFYASKCLALTSKEFLFSFLVFFLVFLFVVNKITKWKKTILCK